MKCSEDALMADETTERINDHDAVTVSNPFNFENRISDIRIDKLSPSTNLKEKHVHFNLRDEGTKEQQWRGEYGHTPCQEYPMYQLSASTKANTPFGYT